MQKRQRRSRGQLFMSTHAYICNLLFFAFLSRQESSDWAIIGQLAYVCLDVSIGNYEQVGLMYCWPFINNPSINPFNFRAILKVVNLAVSDLFYQFCLFILFNLRL